MKQNRSFFKYIFFAILIIIVLAVIVCTNSGLRKKNDLRSVSTNNVAFELTMDEGDNAVEEKDAIPKEDALKPENENIIFDSSDWRLILINKQHPIPSDYEAMIGEYNSRLKCDQRIAADLTNMIEDAKAQGIILTICSPYRDMERQEMLFRRKLNKYIKGGYTYLDAFKLTALETTVPGSSEHQVGLAIDFLTKGYTTLNEGFKDTKAGIWLKENCATYGFILRYPEGKEDITGIEFEPWHFRYVGKEAANIIMKENISLEEFWEKYL